jgi:phenylpropionate dioxygenase-like ring-hydroxylating dioxygenase large terminal subunit
MTSFIEPATWADRYPEVLATSPMVESCTSPEYFRLEKERLFGKVWLCVGREEVVAEPGQYFVKDIAVCDASVLVARGRDRVLRAFHNVCRHRGNKLVWEARRGSARSFVCGNHGWSYGPDGRLVGVPAQSQFRDFNRAHHGLAEITLDVWQGFVFVTFDPAPAQTLIEFIGEIGNSISGYQFGGKIPAFKYSAIVNANWKLGVDAFSETYHAAYVHKRSIGDAARSRENPFANPLDITLYDMHRQVSVYARPEENPTTTGFTAVLGGNTMAGDSSPESLTRGGRYDDLPRGVNPTRQLTWSFDVDVIFPNIIIDVFEHMYAVMEFWPISVDQTYWSFTMYLPPGGAASMLFAGEHAKVGIRDVALEDFATLEHTQVGLRSGSLTQMVLQDSELALRHQYKVVEDYVRYFKRSENGGARS